MRRKERQERDGKMERKEEGWTEPPLIQKLITGLELNLNP